MEREKQLVETPNVWQNISLLYLFSQLCNKEYLSLSAPISVLREVESVGLSYDSVTRCGICDQVNSPLCCSPDVP